MIIDGNLETLNINGSFDMKNENGEEVFNVSRNKYMNDKMYIKSPVCNIEYLGEIIHTMKSEEFVLFEEDSEVLRIKKTSSIGVPKFEIISPFGDFSTKIALIKRSLSLLDGNKEVLSFAGTPSQYQLNIDDNCNTFYVMCIAYGITALLNLE
ncbi:MAG: hypothetical protein AB1Z23_10530 [Eubacteriales bacterium]